MKHPYPHFYALPDDIYDVLYSSVKKYPMDRLRSYAIDKGLVLSSQLSRDDLCMRIASLSFSYNDFYKLSESI